MTPGVVFLIPPLLVVLAADAVADQPQDAPALRSVPEARSSLPAPGRRLTEDEARTIAIRFAPRFRFHAEEPYLPVHPLFALGRSDGPWPERRAAVQALGSANDRIRRYLALTLEEKAGRAVVFYDVYADDRLGPGRIVAEYWLYFVESRYRTQRGFFPFSLDLSHPNDFERVFLILAPSGGIDASPGDAPASLLGIERIVANAHDGRVPNNVTPAGAGIGSRPLVLVELGSHSLSPDVDGDGRTLARLDVEPGRITWGLRDTGRIWAWTSPADAVVREPRASTTLAPAGAVEGAVDRTYELEPVALIAGDFRRLSLSPAEEEAAFRGRVHPLKRLFGKSDGGAPALRRPTSSPDHEDAVRLLEDGRERQRSLSLGFTNLFDHYSAMIGGRLPLAIPPRPWPVLTADVGVVFPPSGPVMDAELLASYEIDTQVDLFAGAAWLATRAGSYQTDWLVGLQLQLGRVRLRGAFRRAGEVNDDQADFRIQYDVWR